MSPQIDFNPKNVSNLFKLTDKNFRSGCKTGNLDKAKYLARKIPSFNVSMCEEFAFRLTCLHGQLDVCKWLLSIKPTIDISARNEHAFRESCRNGHLEVCKWLLTVKPTINISDRNDEAFRYSCSNGHLDVAKFLLSIKPTIDISANDEYAFQESCVNGRLEMAEWILSLNPIKYNLTIINNKITQWGVSIIYPFQQLPEGKPIEECPICYENPSTLMTNCGHMFCQSCVENYDGITCPMCRHHSVTFTRFV